MLTAAAVAAESQAAAAAEEVPAEREAAAAAEEVPAEREAAAAAAEVAFAQEAAAAAEPHESAECSLAGVGYFLLLLATHSGEWLRLGCCPMRTVECPQPA